MTREDAAAVAQMARELAAVLEDPEPTLDPNDLVREASDPSVGSIVWWQRSTAD